MEIEDYAKKLSELLTVVSSTRDIRARSDLYKVYQNCKAKYIELSKESVECRRLKRLTPKFKDIQYELDESINIFEQWITFAALLYT